VTRAQSTDAQQVIKVSDPFVYNNIAIERGCWLLSAAVMMEGEFTNVTNGFGDDNASSFWANSTTGGGRNAEKNKFEHGLEFSKKTNCLINK
jgi:hypothetical protein